MKRKEIPKPSADHAMKDEQARILLSKIFNDHRAELLSAAYKYLENLEDSKDAVQQSFFLILSKYLGRFADSKNPVPYMITVVVNESIRLSKKKKNATDLGMQLLQYQPVQVEEFEETISRMEGSDLLSKCKSKLESSLSPFEIEVFTLWCLGYTTIRIAQDLGYHESRRPIETAISRAKSKCARLKPWLLKELDRLD